MKRSSAIINKIPDDSDTIHTKSICLANTWTDLDSEDSFPFTGVNVTRVEDFNENNYPKRKYNKDVINDGKKFFKFRFIQKKLKEKEKKTKSNKNQNELTLSGLDKEKDFRIYNSDFLLLIEKSILSFNNKNYKESYDILFNSGIIRSITEYGEFLLVVSGFDKYLIGEFLAKEKPPNDKKEVLNSFISSIHMIHNEITLLDCIRFLLSRINLPKDSNLILVIMETFTNIFFKINEKKPEFIQIFKNESNIYLLISTLLALNTMFTRKDIKNMNVIKKEEFRNMNNKINDNYLNFIYDQLKNKPITMSDDYNEYIYQKLTPLVNENTDNYDSNNKSLPKKETPGNKKLSKKNSKVDLLEKEKNNTKLNNPKSNFDTFTKEDEELLCNKTKFYKISGAKTPNLYDVIVYDNCTKLAWDKCFDWTKLKKSNILNIIDINEVYNGIDIAEHSSLIKKYIKANPNEEKLCNTFISISYCNNKESLNLKCDNVELTLLWFKALKSLVNLKNSEEFSKKSPQTDEEQKEREKTIIEIWQHILQKWDKYGNYLILKINEKSNFFSYLSNEYKQSTKNELLEEKKSNTIRYINNFLDNLKSSMLKKDIEDNEFYFLCNLGFPTTLRKKFWRIIIGNPCFLTENLYNSIKNKITDLQINFSDLEKKYDINKNNKLYSKDEKINQMIIDIIISKHFFIDDIKQKDKQYKLMLSVYKIARIFFSFRSDIPYNKLYIDILYLFLLVEDNEENVFIMFTNFILTNSFLKLLIGNETLRKEINEKYILLFNYLIKTKLPNIESHLTQMEIIPDLYFIPWMDDLYIKVLNIKILFQIFDLYILNGEYILFQTGLAILKILEDELTNMTISQVLVLLKRLPDKYQKDKFFEVFNSINGVKNDYVDFKRNNEIYYQKSIFNSS